MKKTASFGIFIDRAEKGGLFDGILFEPIADSWVVDFPAEVNLAYSDGTTIRVRLAPDPRSPSLSGSEGTAEPVTLWRSVDNRITGLVLSGIDISRLPAFLTSRTAYFTKRDIVAKFPGPTVGTLPHFLSRIKKWRSENATFMDFLTERTGLQLPPIVGKKTPFEMSQSSLPLTGVSLPVLARFEREIFHGVVQIGNPIVNGLFYCWLYFCSERQVPNEKCDLMYSRLEWEAAGKPPEHVATVEI